MELFEKTESSETLFEGRILRLRRDTARLSNGALASREVVEHPGGVCVAAVDGDKNVYLVDQFRYPFKKVITELPAGKLEWGEEPDSAAVRELSEETGFTADSVERVGYMYPSPGFSDEILYMYIATGLHAGEQHLDEDEFLRCYPVKLSEAVEMVMDGRIVDAKTQTLLLLAERRLG